MKTIGIPNPLITIVGVVPLSFSIVLLLSIGTHIFEIIEDVSSFIITILLALLFVIGPAFLLMTVRLIIISEDYITLVYPFRFKTKKYLKKDLKTVFTQKMLGNSSAPIDFNQTYLYFGEEKRIRFSAIEFINYRQLRKKFEQIRDSI